MATKSLTFDIYGRDKTASKTMKGVGREAESLGKKFSGVAKGIGMAAAAGIAALTVAATAFAVESVKAFAEAEEQQRKLEDAFERFPALADTNIEAIRRMNSALAKKTRFDDDAIAVGQAQLAQYGLTGEQLKDLTPLLLDYAARTGKDLPTAAGDLGKALLGQGRALKDIGIDFKDTGTVAGNLAQLVAGLGSQVSGFAEKDAATAAGQLEILRNRFGEIQEKIGEALMPALGKLMDFFESDVMPGLEDFATWLADTGIPAVQEFGAWLGGNKDILGPAAIAIGGVTAAVWLLNAAMAANPVTWIAAAVIAVIALATAVTVFYEDIKKFIDENPWAGVVLAFIGGTAAIAFAINWIIREWDTLVAAFNQAGAVIGGIVSRIVGVVQGMASVVRSRVEDIVGFFRSIPSRIMAFFGGAGSWLVSAGRDLIGGFVDGIRSMLGSVGSAVGDVMSFVAGFFPHSPAKRGPFSGAGWRRVLEGGVALGEQFTTGLQSVTGGMAFGSIATATATPPRSVAGGPSIASVSAVPLSGMSISGRLEIGGDGFARLVDGRINSYDASSSRAQVQGFRP
ncbi:hypothetical protein [Agromyces lapidis]|uniref:Tape measure protein n=1 Tax=Agromyces lapidis TaxID=279574 RepID=A0ABV5SMG6_9MICO|nr:hypothetical protein [Agromyces lapidis]